MVLVMLAALVATSATSFAQAPASAGPGTTTQPSKRPQLPTEQPAGRRAQKPAKELGGRKCKAFGTKPAAACGRGMAPQVKAMQAPYDQQICAVLTPERKKAPAEFG